MDETELLIIKDMQAGSEEAFEWLFDRYQKKLFRTAYLISGNYADSEDIVQETMIKCFRHRMKLSEPVCFESWLYQILTRTAWQLCKRKNVECPVEEIWEETKEDNRPLPLEDTIRQETERMLYQAVCSLDIKQRTVVILYYYNEMSTKEIAKVMQCLDGTVKSRLFTARRNLKKLLRENQMEEDVYERGMV